MQSTSLRGLLRSYWKVPVVAVLAALIAYLGSFFVGSTYQATTHLLVRARDTSYLTANGTSLNQTPAVLDSSLVSALSDTQSALLSTDTVARMVVQKLHLDHPAPPSGFFGSLKHDAGAIVKHLKDYVLYGGYKSANPYDAAVATVSNDLSATQVKTGFVLEIDAKSSGPKLAAAIANAAADALVQIGNERFARDSQAYRNLLHRQLVAAQRQQVQASNAVAAYEKTHHISDVSAEIALSVQNHAALQQQLDQSRTQLSSTQAQLADVQQELATTPQQSSSSQRIVTGRSSTTIDNTAQSSLYQSLLTQQNQLRAQAAGLGAQVAAEQAALSSSQSGTPLTRSQAKLQQLALTQQIAQQTQQSLAQEYQQAQLNTVGNTVELTRVDTALPPTFPVSPKRYMYLLVGLIIGATIGFVAVHRRVRGRASDTVDLTDDEPATVAIPEARRPANGVVPGLAHNEAGP